MIPISFEPRRPAVPGPRPPSDAGAGGSLGPGGRGRGPIGPVSGPMAARRPGPRRRP